MEFKGSELAKRQQVKLALTGDRREDLWAAIELVRQEGGPQDRQLEAVLRASLWRSSRRRGFVHWLDDCRNLYELQQDVEADVLMLDGKMHRIKVPSWMTWESLLAQREARLPEFSRKEWRRFCLERLDVNPNTASSDKRAWEVFAVVYGWTEEEMARAGKSVLRQAAGEAERCWNEIGEIDPILVQKMIGEAHICQACGAWTDYEGDAPEACGHCGVLDWEMKPAGLQAVQKYIQEKQDKRKGKEAIETAYDFAIDLSGDDDRQALVVAWVQRPGAERAEPYNAAMLTWVSGGKVDPEKVADGAQILTGDELAEMQSALRERIAG